MSRKLRPLDEFDKRVMQSVLEQPGRCMREYLLPHIRDLSEAAGRSRIMELELRGLVLLKKTKREVLVWPTETLKSMLDGSIQAGGGAIDDP